MCVMSNALIDGGYKLTLTQLKMFLFLIAEVKRSEGRDVYKIFVSDLRDIKIYDNDGTPEFLSKSLYNTIYGTLQSLLNTRIIVTMERKGVLFTRDIILLTSFDYYTNAGYFYFTISKDMEKHIVDLEERFTVYDIRNVIMCRSVFSIRIYMILKSFVKLKEREIHLDELREMLGIEGKYRLYGDIKRYVLLRAQRELKKCSDMFFEFKEIRKGKRVYSIHFKINKQKKIFSSKKTDVQTAIPYQEWCKIK